MGRAPCCDKANVKKGPWSTEEDAKLKEYIEKYGTASNWIALPQKAGLKRCGKSCRLRWLNYLRPNIKHGEFSDEEDRIICSLFANIGSRWSIIAGQLPGRTDNDIKNYWNTKLKKKLMGINANPPNRRSTHIQSSSSLTNPPLSHLGNSSNTLSSDDQVVQKSRRNGYLSSTMESYLVFGGAEPTSSSSDGSRCSNQINVHGVSWDMDQKYGNGSLPNGEKQGIMQKGWDFYQGQGHEAGNQEIIMLPNGTTTTELVRTGSSEKPNLYNIEFLIDDGFEQEIKGNGLAQVPFNDELDFDNLEMIRKLISN
ncbi:hypothetical protein Dimus_034658 [Dionaea muscipula]